MRFINKRKKEEKKSEDASKRFAPASTQRTEIKLEEALVEVD